MSTDAISIIFGIVTPE